MLNFLSHMNFGEPARVAESSRGSRRPSNRLLMRAPGPSDQPCGCRSRRRVALPELVTELAGLLLGADVMPALELDSEMLGQPVRVS